MTGFNYYVYIYYSEEWVPYYVGKGVGKRCFDRREITVPTREYIQRFYFLTEQEAFDTEVQLIAHFGRVCDGGTLMNKTIGGPGMSGFSPSEETRQKLSISNAPKVPVYLTDPAGLKHTVYSCSAFARDNSLSQSHLARVIRGECLSHKGWRLSLDSPHLNETLLCKVRKLHSKPTLPDRGERRQRLNPVVFLDLDGNAHEITDLRSFAKEFGLTHSAVCSVARGAARQNKGWTVSLDSPHFNGNPPDISRLRLQRGLDTPVYFVSPDGVLFEVYNVTEFAFEHGLTKSGLSFVAKGNRSHHKGWTLHPSSPHLKLK
jgi:hypothetical protein